MVIDRVGHEIYLTILRAGVLLVLKWAPQPLFRFMKVREWTGITPISYSIVSTANGKAALIVAMDNGFWIGDITVGPLKLLDEFSGIGKPIKVVDIGGGTGLMMLCFERKAKILF